jgi:PleD family two-component response regulator
MASAQALRSATRSVDVCGRLPNGRLALLMPDTPLKGGSRACEKLLAAFSRQKVKLGDKSLLGGIPLNLGVVELKGSGETLQQALERAEAALQMGLAKGRNQMEAR